MSATYSGDPSSSALDRLRFILGDTDMKAATLQNEEINYAINLYTDDVSRLALLFRQMATNFGIKIAKRTLGPQSEDSTSRIKYFEKQAELYEKRLAYTGTPPLPAYDGEKVFYVGMMTPEEG